MPDRFPKRTAFAIVATCFALFLVGFFGGVFSHLTREGSGMTSTPVPSGMRQPETINLQPGQRACETGIVIDPRADLVRLDVPERAKLPREPLEVTLDAPGYSASARGQGGRQYLQRPFDAPARALVGTACVRNAGTGPTVFGGTADPRVLERTRAALDGAAPGDVAFALTFKQAHPGSLLSTPGTTADRAASFNALGPWALWTLLGLLAVVLPACLLGAYYLALRGRDGDESAGS